MEKQERWNFDGLQKRKIDMETTFEMVTAEMLNMYQRKNADYGNSFAETTREFGFIPAVARINDKLKRVKNMVKGQEMNIIKDESLRDNLMDIANYCVLTIIELDKQK